MLGPGRGADQSRHHCCTPQVIVFGGNGYVGSRVVQAALSRGASVVSVNRSGQPKDSSESWVSKVKWVAGKVHEGC